MYVTKTEQELARARHFLLVAQNELAIVRRVSARDATIKPMIREYEDHVKRHLTYVANAQDAVLRQRKKDPGAILGRMIDVPVQLEIA